MALHASAPRAALRAAGALLRKLGGAAAKLSTLGLPRRFWTLFYGGYLAALVAKALRRKLRAAGDAYDGLDGIVSFSSRMIAGAWSLVCFTHTAAFELLPLIFSS